MSPDQYIAKLTVVSKKLAGLLEDPQPGYFTWIEALDSVQREICVLFLGKERVDRVTNPRDKIKPKEE